jgi:arylsulfatase A-like enzyme
MQSGCNHHCVGMGYITEFTTSSPGNSSVRPNSCAPLALTLKLNSDSTAQFGKCQGVPVWQTSPVGPFACWPSGGGGVGTFYGFIAGETNQYYPALYNGTTPVDPPALPEDGYHFTDGIATRAVNWMRQQKALAPDKPFFLYVAPGSTHARHHVPR